MNLTELSEALNTILPYQLIRDTPQLKLYGTAYNGIVFAIEFTTMMPRCAVVTFYELDEHNQPIFDITNKIQYAGYLFATIIKIINDEFVNFDVLAYTASGNSRKSLYGALAKKYAKSKAVYIIPTAGADVTVISANKIDDEVLRNITQAASDKLA